MAVRKRKCKMCGDYISDFIVLPVGVFCSYEKAIEYTNARQGRERVEKAKKQTMRQRRKKFYDNDLKTQKRLAGEWFRRYIRLRDKDKPCVSCGAPAGTYRIEAGHYKTQGAHPELAYDEDNCHGQCHKCNHHLSANLIAYREELIKRIGKRRVMRLERYHRPVKRYASDYAGIKKKYQNKCKDLENA